MRMIRIVKQGKLSSSLIVLYLQVVLTTILAEQTNNKQIEKSLKFYTTNNNRTLNLSLIQEKSKLKQQNRPSHQLNNANFNLWDNSSSPSNGSSIEGRSSNDEGDNVEQLARPVSDIDTGEGEHTNLDGASTVIVEDLVNQFLEKNSDAMRKGSNLAQTDSNRANNDDDYTIKQVNNHSNDGQTNDSLVSGDGGISITTPSPSMQLISAQLNEGEQRNNDLQLTLQQQQESSQDIEDTDRHIQYDVIEPEQTTHHKQKLHPRHVKNELNLLKSTNSAATITNDNNETVSQEREREHQQISDVTLQSNEQLGGQNVSSSLSSQIFSTNTTGDESSTSKNELIRQQQQQQQVVGGGAAANSSVLRMVQARSMSNIVASLNKTPQHTRPPYATYDQFSHRSSNDVNSNNQQHAFNDQPQAATPSMVTAATNSTMQQSGIGNNNKTSNVQDAVTIVNSISRISSQLASDTAKGDSSAKQRQQQRQQIMAEKPDQSIQELQNIDEETNSTNNNKKFQHQLHKLATSDQLVELNPIPVLSNQAVPSYSEQTQSKEGFNPQDFVNRFYSAKENQLFNYFSPPNTLSARGGQSVGAENKYNSNYNNKDQDQESSASIASSFFSSNEISSQHQQQLAKLAGQYPGHENKISSVTLDSRSNPEQQYDKLLQERMREVQNNNNINNNNNNNNNNNSPDKHHYAASLINVTAPMILPLSATEAMESALGDPAAKNLIHQVSGFLRPPSSSSLTDQLVKSTATATKLNQPPRSSQYYVTSSQAASSSPSSSSSDSRLPTNLQQSIYSQPANQFSPPAKIHSTTSNEAAAAAANSDSYLLEERMRLNRNNGYILAGRKPPVGYSASGGGPHINQTATTTATHQASGFRSPLQNPTTISASSLGGTSSTPSIWPSTRLPSLSSYLSGSLSSQMAAAAGAASERPPPPTTINNMISSSSSIATPSSIFASSESSSRINSNGGTSSTLAAITSEQSTNNSGTSRPPPSSPHHTQSYSQQPFPGTATTSSMNGMINVGNDINNNTAGSQGGGESSSSGSAGAGSGAAAETSGLTRPVFNLTRVEHISAECSNDLIRTVIIFNGTFKGIIYSSGYVRDPSCVYINGTGKTRYQFNIRLNQCGTLGRQELHPPVGPNEIRRRDQVMWNTLSIQYNPIIEQEWDEHFRVSCEYGSDFWKTVSFNPFNVETNTGSPVVFTVDPPQCQMEILRGHGMVGPRQEAVSGPVTVGDPLTLLIHMKSEKAGYDILVKNCIAHNGGHQKMQLIDNNGCVVNERFISPFRGTYNDNDMKHVTLYSYLKAFRFTGSPVLYLECEIHMCQSSCPPQMCYWRRLSKRSASSNETTTTTTTTTLEPNGYPMLGSTTHAQAGQYQDDFLNQEFSNNDEIKASDQQQQQADDAQLGNKATKVANTNNKRQLRMLNFGSTNGDAEGDGGTFKSSRLIKSRSKSAAAATTTTEKPLTLNSGQISDKVSLFQALEVRQEREPENAPFSSSYTTNGNHITALDDNTYFNNTYIDSMSTTSSSSLTCYRRAEILAFLFTTISIILVAVGISVGFCWRAANLRKMQRQGKTNLVGISGGLSSANSIISKMSSINNLLCKNASADTSSMSSCSTASPTSSQHHQHQQPYHHHHHHHHQQQQQQQQQHCNADSSWTPHPTHQIRLSPILQHHSTSRHKERPL